MIHYDLNLDALRAKARASFMNSDDRRITKNFTIKERERKCIQETFIMSASALIFTCTWYQLGLAKLKESDP